MFLAIINDSYSDVKADIDGSKNDFELGSYFKTGYDKMLTKMNVKKEKIRDIQNILDTETGEDESIEFEKWRSELKVCRIFLLNYIGYAAKKSVLFFW